MTPLVIILGPTGAGRADLVRELAAHAWPEGRRIRVLREAREGGEPADQWRFEAGQAILPAPGDEDAAILVTHGALHVIDQMEALHRAIRPTMPDAVWQVARILTVVDCPLAAKYPAVEEWYRPCVHFSDAVVINRRWEVPRPVGEQVPRALREGVLPLPVREPDEGRGARQPGRRHRRANRSG